METTRVIYCSNDDHGHCDERPPATAKWTYPDKDAYYTCGDCTSAMACYFIDYGWLRETP